MNCWQSLKNSIKKVAPWMPGVAVGVIFLAIGIWGQQLTDMYRKAVMICLECIGIG